MILNRKINKAAIAKAGGVVCIIAALRHHAGIAGLQQSGCHALGAIVMDSTPKNSTGNRDLILKSGGIECVIAAVRRYSNNTELLVTGLKALTNFAVA